MREVTSAVAILRLLGLRLAQRRPEEDEDPADQCPTENDVEDGDRPPPPQVARKSDQRRQHVEDEDRRQQQDKDRVLVHLASAGRNAGIIATSDKKKNRMRGGNENRRFGVS